MTLNLISVRISQLKAGVCNILNDRIVLLYKKKALPFKVKCVIYLSNNLYIHIKHLACNATWFGDGCKSQCGYCLGENNCHHVNGSCLLGCQEGFTGDLCFDRECCIYVL